MRSPPVIPPQANSAEGALVSTVTATKMNYFLARKYLYNFNYLVSAMFIIKAI